MYYSENDSSDQDQEVFTTYSEDERYLKYSLEIQKQNLIREEYRRRKYEKIADEQEHMIFKLQGLNIMKFTDMKIKFSFEPSLLYEYISKKIIFYCSLRYLKRYKKWIICREPMPARPLFKKVTSEAILIDDSIEEIGKVIIKIYKELRRWSENEIIYRRKKIEKYRAGKLCYLDIDSTDEELYFSEDARKELFEKRKAVLKRMIPPPVRTLVKTRSQLKYKI